MKRSQVEKLEDKLSERMRQLPDFVFEYLSFIGDSTEVQTRLEYAKDINIFLDFLIISGACKKENILEITTDDIDQLKERDLINFFQYLTRYKQVVEYPNGRKIEQIYRNSDAGKARKLATLRKLFSYLEKRGYIQKDIAKNYEIKVKKKEQINTRLTPKEIQRLFQTILDDVNVVTEQEEKFHNLLKERDYIMVLLLAYTGIRVSELVQLDIDDIYLANHSFIVTRKGGDEQEIKMPKKIIDDIKYYVKRRKEEYENDPKKNSALFVSLHKKRINPKTVRAMLEKYRERSGIKKNITPHVFRRTFGTNHYNTYKDMYLTAQVLGHKSAETTRKFYADPSKERVDRSMTTFEYEDEATIERNEKLEQFARKLGITVEELLKEIG